MKIKTLTIPELFYLYCALNYNGYDKENNQGGMHPVRKTVREKFSSANLPKYNFRYHPYQYTKQVLTSKNLQPTTNTNPDFFDALNYVNDFKNEMRLKRLWASLVEKETKREIKRYEESITEIKKLLEESFAFNSKAEKVFFTVNLLESYYRGFAISLEKEAYIITGPSDKPNSRNLLHEMIHLYLENLHLGVTTAVNKKIRGIPLHLRENYGGGESIVKESLVRTLVVYLTQKGHRLKKETFSDSDKKLQLPVIFFKRLTTISPKSIDSEILKKIGEPSSL